MIGKTLGAYRIQDQIGMGGMATVYKAYHAATDRYVAVKVLPAHFAQDPKFLKRFEQEARLIAKLEHRNILPVYDFGEQDGITYLVMRYLDAGTLRDLVQTSPLSLKQAADYLSQIASALDYAHHANVIHRDVKPSNVLVDQHGGAFVSDFGIAKMVGGSMDLTGSGLIGTPTYMAPEQGIGQKASPLSDQYALGVVLYEMVVGHVPYQAETPAAVLLMHMQSPLPLPSQARPGLPESVERVILKVLAKDPADRFPDCTTFAEAFEQAVAGLPVDIAVRAEAIEETVAVTPPGEMTSPETSAMTPDAAPSTTPSAPAGRMPIWLWPAIAVLGIAALSTAVYFGLRGLGMVPGPGDAAREVEQGQPTAGPEAPGTATPAEQTTPPEVVSPALSGPGKGRLAEVCPPGLCIYAVTDGRAGDLLARILDDGTELTITDKQGIVPSWSPDGKRLVFMATPAGGVVREDSNLYIVNADGSNLVGLTTSTGDIDPSWSPDGEWLAFTSGGLVLVRPDGTDRQVVSSSGGAFGCVEYPQWSPDGQWIVASVSNPCGDKFPHTRDVRIFAPDGSRSTVVATTEHKSEACRNPAVLFSPDGNQIAYEDGDCRYFIVSADGSGEPAPLAEWPFTWRSNYYPQWGSEASVAAAAEPPTGDTPAEQAENFAAPVLAAIADQPPDLEDDFSNPASGWETGVFDDGWENGQRGYEDGEYFVVAPPAELHPERPEHQEPITCASGGPRSRWTVSDAVIEIEGRYVQFENGDGNWHLNIRNGGAGPDIWWKYELAVEQHGAVRLAYVDSTGVHDTLGEVSGPPVQAGSEPNHVQIIAVGPEFAVYANGEPLFYAVDTSFNEQRASGWFRPTICNTSDEPMEVHWDNVRIWDISDLP